jgi:hypothetical protein
MSTDHARALPTRPATADPILLDGADGLEGGGDLPGLLEARADRVHVRPSSRELGQPEVVEGMAERIDAIAVDVG